MKKRVRNRSPMLASVPHRPHLLAWLKNPANAAAYVKAARDEGDAAGILQALRNVAAARAGNSGITRS